MNSATKAMPANYDSFQFRKDTRTSRPTACNLCGSVGAIVECEKCQSMAFCSSCDDMYHRHPKRRFHLRKSLLCEKNLTQTKSAFDIRSIAGKIFSSNKSSNETKPMLNQGFAAHPSNMPIPPPRRKKRDATLTRGSTPLLMQKFNANSNFRRFQMENGQNNNSSTQQSTPQMNKSFAEQQRMFMKPSNLNQMPAQTPTEEFRRSSYQSSLTGSDVSSEPWTQDMQFEPIPPPLPQKTRWNQTLTRRNLSVNDLCDQYPEPIFPPFYGYPSIPPHNQFVNPWMNPSLSQSMEDFQDDDDQNSVSEYNVRGTLARGNSRNRSQATMRRSQSFMQMSPIPWGMQQFPPYYYYPPYYPPPPPPPQQMFRPHPSPPASVRSMSLRRRESEDNLSIASLNIRDSASIRSESVAKVRSKSQAKVEKSLLEKQIMRPASVSNGHQRRSSVSSPRCLSDSDLSDEESEEFASFSESTHSSCQIKDHWKCRHCTYMNSIEKHICEVCAKSRNLKKRTNQTELSETSAAKAALKQQKCTSDIVITQEMIDEQKEVEKEIRRRLENEQRIAKENKKIERREERMRRKTLSSIADKVQAFEANSAKQVDLQRPASAAAMAEGIASSKPSFSSSHRNQSKSSVKKEVEKKSEANVQQTESKQNDSLPKFSDLKLEREQSGRVSQNVSQIIEAVNTIEITPQQEKIAQNDRENVESTSLKQEANETNDSNTQQPVERIKTVLPQAQQETKQQTQRQQPQQQQQQHPQHQQQQLQQEQQQQQPQPQQQLQDPLTLNLTAYPANFQNQINSTASTFPPQTNPAISQASNMMNPLQLNPMSPQQFPYPMQHQAYPSYADARRASVPFSSMNATYSFSNQNVDLPMTSQFSPSSPYFNSLSRLDHIAAGGMSTFEQIGSPRETFGFKQPVDHRYLSTEDLHFSAAIGSQHHSNMKSGFEMIKLLREAEKKGFTADDVEIALNFSPGNALGLYWLRINLSLIFSMIEWLEENWSNMIETVLTLANNQLMHNEKKKGNTKKGLMHISLISEAEAKDALRAAKGNIWQAIEKCVQRKQEGTHLDGKGTKSFTLKVSELGAGRDNLDKNVREEEEEVREEDATSKLSHGFESLKLEKIEELVESWKKDIKEGKKSKEGFLDTIEELVKQKIEFIDATLNARRKNPALEEDIRRRFIKEYFSDEELDEEMFVHENAINYSDEKANVARDADANEDGEGEESKISKRLSDKTFFVGNESVPQQSSAAKSEANVSATAGEKGKQSSRENARIIEALSEINATLKKSLEQLDANQIVESNGNQSIINENDVTKVVVEENCRSNDEEKKEAQNFNANDALKIDEALALSERSESRALKDEQSVKPKVKEGKKGVKKVKTKKQNDKEAKNAENAVKAESSTNAGVTAKMEAKTAPNFGTRATYECELCAGTFKLVEMVSLPSCTHSACIECLQQYFTVQIREKQKVIIPCPFCNQPEINHDDEDAVSNYLIILDQLLKALLPDDIHELFERKVRDRALQKDPSFRWCSQCSSGFLAGDSCAQTIMCPDCKAITCSKCNRLWEKQHSGISCEKFAEWKKANDPKFAESQLDLHLKQFGIDCPNCKFHYELSKGGCIHFHCLQCGHDFCGGCQMPFKMGDKCNQSQWCNKLGFHAHHPRNCLFYLRDREVAELKKLLDINGVKYETQTSYTAKNAKGCPVMEQKETEKGMIDASCNKEILTDGLCKNHYIEYLSELIRKNKVDPIAILTEDEMVHLLRRANIKLPIKTNAEVHLNNLRQIIQEELPLCQPD